MLNHRMTAGGAFSQHARNRTKKLSDEVAPVE
jgi:hypothetical protein